MSYIASISVSTINLFSTFVMQWIWSISDYGWLCIGEEHSQSCIVIIEVPLGEQIQAEFEPRRHEASIFVSIIEFSVSIPYEGGGESYRVSY